MAGAWTDAGVLADVRRHVEPGATLARDEANDRFDILPLLVTTDGAIAAFGRDVRRPRPNILIGGVDGLAEPPGGVSSCAYATSGSAFRACGGAAS
jgi:hypothetical protein